MELPLIRRFFASASKRAKLSLDSFCKLRVGEVCEVMRYRRIQINLLGWFAVEPITDLLQRIHFSFEGRIDQDGRQPTQLLDAALVLLVNSKANCLAPFLVGPTVSTLSHLEPLNLSLPDTKAGRLTPLHVLGVLHHLTNVRAL